MSVDLGDLLRQAGGDPSAPVDPDDIWRRGRRRRRLRAAAASAAGLAVVAVLVAVPLIGGPGLQPVIEPLAPDEPAPAEDDATADDAGEDTSPTEDIVPTDDTTTGEDIVAPEGPTDDELHALEQQLLDEASEQVQERQAEAEEQASAQPDPARVADPCAVHEGGEMRAFIDVVAPVDGQQVGAIIDLVGCSSVYEGTIQYRIVDTAGNTLLEDFTTATAGGPEIGEFRETIEIPTTGELYLEVYWADAASGDEQHPDGPERDLVRIAINAG
jgi:hypothetical protein